MKDATYYERFGGTGAEACPRAYWNAPILFNPGAGVAGTAVAAVVNEGRWVVSCPAPRCGGAQLASLTDLRFMCVTCANATNGGSWRPVVLPASLATIVAALDARSHPADQNWVPGETVAALLAENRSLILIGGVLA